MLTDLGESLREPLDHLKKILAKVDAILGEETTQNNLRETVQGARDFVVKLNETLDEVRPEVRRTFEEAANILSENRSRVAATLDNAQMLTGDMVKRELPGRLQNALDQAGTTLKRADEVVIENALNLYLTIRHLREASYHAEIFTQKIRSNPALLLFGGSEPQEFRGAVDFKDWRLDGRAARYDKEP
jgi:ABC-type transporter Mla subunit MlaD